MTDASRYTDPDKSATHQKPLAAQFEIHTAPPIIADMGYIDGDEYTANEPKPYRRTDMFDGGPRGNR